MKVNHAVFGLPLGWQGGGCDGDSEREAGAEVHRSGGGGDEEHRSGQPQEIAGRPAEGGHICARCLHIGAMSPLVSVSGVPANVCCQGFG